MRDIRFNQGFALNRERLGAMLRCIGAGQATSDESVGTFMGVNPHMVEGYRGWLCKTGLGSATSTTYTLSPLGKILLRYDPELSLSSTQWLLHFFLVSQQDRKSTRLNSSHSQISYAVFC